MPGPRGLAFFYLSSMIRYNVPMGNNYGTREYVIYEAHDTLPQGIMVHEYYNMRYAMRGEWIRDSKGRVVPILRRFSIGSDVLFIFPGFSWKLKAFADRTFTYPNDPNFSVGKMNARHALFARLVGRGMDWYKAYLVAFPRTPIRAAKSAVFKLLNNDAFFILFLQELNIMSDLKKHLEQNHGITDTEIIDTLVELMKDKDEAPSLRKYAIETIFNITTKSDKKEDKKQEMGALQESIAAGILAISQSVSQRSREDSLGSVALIGDGTETSDINGNS